MVARGGSHGIMGTFIASFIQITLYSTLPTSLDRSANLKEAIDWILRVTGKDGQDQGGGQGGTQQLAEAVAGLLEGVKSSSPELDSIFQKVMSALGTSGSDGLIGKLAEGLQRFIGYSGTKTSSGPIITGGGILPANVAKHQVCNAVLNFIIRFLEGLCEIKELASHHEGVMKVIGTLRKCVGTGQVPKGFKELVEKIGERVQEIDTKLKQNQNKLHNAFDRFKTLVTTLNYREHGSINVTQDSEQVKSFLDTVNKSVRANGSGNFRNLCDKLKDLFGENEIKKLSTSLSNSMQLNVDLLNNKTTSLTNAAKNPGLNSDINNLKTRPEFTNHTNAAVFSAVRDAATAFIAELQAKAYTSFYHDTDWGKVSSDDDKTKCAKIFLGCLPLYYQALTYIYWGCHEHGGGWRNLTLANGTMRSYFDSQGLLPTFVESSRTGAHIADTALQKSSELQAAASSLSTTESPYVKFTKKLQANVKEHSGQLADNCPLSVLFYGASYYFRCQQIKVSDKAFNTPKTIREMLYFLAAFQFSPQYDAFDGYVTEYFQTMTGSHSQDDSTLKLQVADSGQKSGGNTLSAADLKSYLASTFHLAPAFIGLIQEPSTSDEPWLHSLFSNSQFNLSIPSSGAGIFSTISNYAYALQFQLSFLYIQCNNTYTLGCGWRDCNFGKDINMVSNTEVLSHICKAYNCGYNNVNCSHNATNGCNHNNYEQNVGCGSTKASPLQAFLTDCLPGFSRSHPSDPSSHLASCSGSLCHVPMGFDGKLCAEASSGLNIAYSLGSFCGGFNTPLRQLSEKLGCLTKRTPRTLGDLFGFVWHLKGQLAKTLGNFNDATWFGELKDKLPFSYQLTKDSGENLKKFVGTDHSAHQTSPADLTSLYSP
ncbi:variant erythrocyte surface antigen-1 family protein [Babesia caballi]|uniref:Variant erythrocyte surface antigen-1 family protein n=1 Tax=Babesia caballi TaxID=5871 RepID=A0AAV4M2P8_BABCB|nr:variant erythrocyte surface antigen-1 family protein [Babesia caballi]